MNLDQIRAFVAVSETGSFTAAANRLAISKQSVSRRIADLERGLGGALLVRGQRGVKCTSAGQVFLEHAKSALRELELGLNSLALHASEPAGEVWIGAPALFAKHFLAPLVAELTRESPGIQVGICALGRADLLDLDHLDVIIAFGELPDLAAKRLVLGEAVNGCYAAPSYLERNPGPAMPDELPDHECLAYSRQRGPSVWRLARNEEEREIVIHPRVTSNDADVVLQTALLGAGIAHLPRFLCEPAVERGDLTEVLPGWSLRVGTIAALYLQNRQPRPELDRLLDLIRDRLLDRTEYAGVHNQADRT